MLLTLMAFCFVLAHSVREGDAAVFLRFLNVSNTMPYAFGNLHRGSWRFASYLLTLYGWDVMSRCLWHFGWVYFFIVSTSMEGLYMIQ